MHEQIVKQFKIKYEALDGIVHLVADSNEAIKVVASILNEAAAELIAIGELPEELLYAIAAQCERDEIEILKPPFKNSELLRAIDKAEVGISKAAFAIAETGTIVEFTTNDALRLVSSLPGIHIAIIKAEEIVEKLKEATTPIRDFYAQNPENGVVTFISGPSRTADIEMRLTLGVHGPETSHVIVLM